MVIAGKELADVKLIKISLSSMLCLNTRFLHASISPSSPLALINFDSFHNEQSTSTDSLILFAVSLFHNLNTEVSLTNYLLTTLLAIVFETKIFQLSKLLTNRQWFNPLNYLTIIHKDFRLQLAFQLFYLLFIFNPLLIL